MTCSDVPHYNIFIDIDGNAAELHRTVSDLVTAKIKPEWTNQKLKFELLAGGITNKILCCWNGQNKNDRILFRIYGEKTELIIDREAEKESMKLLSSHGYAAPIYCTVSNGVGYGFVPGNVLDRETVREQKIASLVAKRMAQIHSIKLSTNSTFEREPVFFKQMETVIKNFPERLENETDQKKYETEFLPFLEMKREYELLKERMIQLKCPVVFCHNDLLLKNLIYDPEEECVTFIDFEYGGFNYQAYDIADHFTEFAGVDDPDFSRYPDRDYQLWWLKCYLNYLREFNQRNKPSDQDVETLYVQVNVLALAAHFFWAVWAVVQARYSSINFGYLQYGVDRLNEYFKLKPKFWNLELPHCDQ